MRIHKLAFYISVLLLPVNLGKHFVVNEAYINGRLVDYLVPAVFLPDILIAITLILWLIEMKNPLKHLWETLISNKVLPTLLLFLVSLFFAVLSSPLFVPAVYFFVRTVFYFLFCMYVYRNFDVQRDFPVVLKILLFQILFLSLLAFAQWYKQGSVFNNYLVFGEQPYSYSTQNVIKENFFGVTKIPPYSIFRHPNTFAGYLSIVLVWVFYSFKNSKKSLTVSLFIFLLGMTALFLSLSYMAWASFVIGILMVFILEKLNITFRKLLFLVSLFVMLLGFSIVFLQDSSSASFQRRSDLIQLSYKMFRQNPLFGIGVNNSTAFMERYQVDNNNVRFPQPTHNIFMLILTESGFITAFLFVLSLILLSLKKGKFYILGVTLFQIYLLGSVDHYLITAHQTSALMWLTFGMALIQFY